MDCFDHGTRLKSQPRERSTCNDSKDVFQYPKQSMAEGTVHSYAGAFLAITQELTKLDAYEGRKIRNLST
ncbi:hypothetical protein J6590_056020 [Homalodisca vitripennis]|nr:hypothetical protein J6590_056020 [Homalodisca vitripennis]